MMIITLQQVYDVDDEKLTVYVHYKSTHRMFMLQQHKHAYKISRSCHNFLSQPSERSAQLHSLKPLAGLFQGLFHLALGMRWNVREHKICLCLSFCVKGTINYGIVNSILKWLNYVALEDLLSEQMNDDESSEKVRFCSFIVLLSFKTFGLKLK